jgi:hypothetical protein
MLGLRPDAANGVLYVNPHLPNWLPEIELHNVQIGRSVVGIRFWLEGDDTHFEVRHHQGRGLDVLLEGPEIPTPEATGRRDLHRSPRRSRER